MSHLDLQPDNVVMTSLREPSVKLVDFAAARRVEFDGTKVNVNGLTEFIGEYFNISWAHFSLFSNYVILIIY